MDSDMQVIETLAPALPITSGLDFGVVWKKHARNGHYAVALPGTPAWDFYGDWDISEFMDYESQRACKAILVQGGKYVLWPACEEDAPEILHRGEYFDGENAIKVRGKPSQCHRNSADMWVRHPDDYTIATGYALSDDGLWRQHTWLIRNDGAVIETTVRRIGYYGFRLSTSESWFFLSNNR